MFEAVKDFICGMFVQVDGVWFVTIYALIGTYIGLVIGAVICARPDIKKKPSGKPTPEEKEKCI